MTKLSKNLTPRNKFLRIAIRAKNLGPDVNYTDSRNCALARSIRQQLNLPDHIEVGVDYHNVNIGNDPWMYTGKSYCYVLFLEDQKAATGASSPDDIIRIVQLEIRKHDEIY